MNRGTQEGKEQEKELVRQINLGTYGYFFDQYFEDSSNFYGVRVTEKKFSKKTKLNVLPKSDVFLIRTNEKLTGFLKERNNYLEECDLRNLRSSGFIYENVSGSGISVKLVDSTSYQIHKFTVRSFLKVFNDPYLGAGAMLYSKHEKDFLKNKKILGFWELTEREFFSHFESNSENYQSSNSMKHMLLSINKKCLSDIKFKINSTLSIKSTVFDGKNDFDEPFGASFSFIGGVLRKYEYTDFSVTQGSGRTRNPTIVIKPKF